MTSPSYLIAGCGRFGSRVAICVFVVKNITKVPISVIYKGVAPFLISLILVWGLLFIFPQLALWLPSVFYK